MYEARVGLLELARRAGADDNDIFFVTEPELESYLAEPGRYADEVANRRKLRDTMAGLVPPFWFAGTLPDPSTWEAQAAPVPATRRIPNGTHITIDGTTGTVVIG